jgi:hypothetical protein
MSNMSYCRFGNTLSDLLDCNNNLFNKLEKGSDEEHKRLRLIECCWDIVNKIGLDNIETEADIRTMLEENAEVDEEE